MRCCAARRAGLLCTFRCLRWLLPGAAWGVLPTAALASHPLPPPDPTHLQISKKQKKQKSGPYLDRIVLISSSSRCQLGWEVGLLGGIVWWILTILPCCSRCHSLCSFIHRFCPTMGVDLDESCCGTCSSLLTKLTTCVRSCCSDG